MRVPFLAFLLILAAVSAGLAETSRLPTVPLTVESNSGKMRTEFTAELAATPEHRAKGLMFRTDLADDHGMLFDFKQTRSVSMWMKNTPLSLDMVFTDDQGAVLYIARDTVPYSEEIITPGMPVYAVLEVKAGTARRLGIEPADNDRAIAGALIRALATKAQPLDRIFFDWRGARDPGTEKYPHPEFRELASFLSGRSRVPRHEYWSDPAPCSMHIEEVERIWSDIAERDDWQAFNNKVKAIRRMGDAIRQDAPQG